MSSNINFSYDQPVMAIPVIDKLESVDVSALNVYDNNDPEPWIADDAIERSSNIFSQVKYA